MKQKVSIVPKRIKSEKSAPDATVYLTSDGTRVRISKRKQFPVGNCSRDWEKKMREELNETYNVVRISDGHALWGCKISDLIPETK